MALTKGCTFISGGGIAGINLTGYSQVGEVTWTYHPNHTGGSIVLTNAERVRSASSNSSLYYTDEIPTSADYTVSGSLRNFSAASSTFVGLASRIRTGEDTFYYCIHNGSAGAWQIWRRISGSTDLIVSHPQTLIAGQDYGFAFSVRGPLLTLEISGTTIRAFDKNITGAGRVGLYAAGSQTNTTRTHFDNFTGYEPAQSSPDITITSPQPYRVFQRDINNVADIQISGSYVGSPTAIEARWNLGSWTTIDSNPSNGIFSGVLTNQSAGQGTLEVRWTNDTSKTNSAEYIGVGEIFAILGQSNAVGQGDNKQQWSHSTLKACVLRNDNNWSELADNHDTDYNQQDSVSQDDSNNANIDGSIWMKFVTDLMSEFNVPVAIIPCCKGATTILQWQPDTDHLDRSTLYGSANYRIGLAGGIRCVLWWQGESDTSTSQSVYNSRLDTLADSLMQDRAIKLMAGKIINVSADETAVNAAIAEAWVDNSNVLEGPDCSDIAHDGDGLHLNEDSKLTDAGARWAVNVSSLISSIYDSDAASVEFVTFGNIGTLNGLVTIPERFLLT